MDSQDELYDKLKDINPNIPVSDEPQQIIQPKNPDTEKPLVPKPKPLKTSPQMIFNNKKYKSKEDRTEKQ